MNEIVASISKSNGAYLVSFDHHDEFQDQPPSDLYDCASSLSVAKRLARSGAKGADWTHLKWEQGQDLGWPEGILLLTGRPPEEGDDIGY